MLQNININISENGRMSEKQYKNAYQADRYFIQAH